MIALLLGLASASELAPYARVDVDHDGLHVAAATTGVISRHGYLYTGLTWQDGIDPLGNGAGLGRPHADIGLVGELGAVHVLALAGAGWDGWVDAPLVVGRTHAVIELPPLPLLIENRTQLEASLGERVDLENRFLFMLRIAHHPAPLAVGAHLEWARTTGVVDERRLGIGPRLNARFAGADLGLMAGWDVKRAQPIGRFTAVMRF